MFRFLPTLALVLASTSTASVHAAAESAGFDVAVNLSAKCVADSLQFGLVSVTYFAFSEFTRNGSIPIMFSCTRGLMPSVSFDTAAGTSSSPGSTATATGVAAGVQYTLTSLLPTKTAGLAASTSSLGGSDRFQYNIQVTVAGGQAGCKAVAGVTSTEVANCSASQTRSFILSF